MLRLVASIRRRRSSHLKAASGLGRVLAVSHLARVEGSTPRSRAISRRLTSPATRIFLACPDRASRRTLARSTHRIRRPHHICIGVARPSQREIHKSNRNGSADMHV